ncbi:MAG: aliphatic sulfonate ABC transporter substrate-binding protein [Myxococcota bacterium]|nr:aliphatic sulfonate ABC transporter substrate-binding protein [Myxococcota bacterium]
MIHQPMGKLLAFALSLVWLLVGCARDRAEQQAAATASAPAERPKSEVSVVRFGYQKIGAPFLLKSRSESLDKRLTEKGAKAEWKEFKAGPALLEAINAKEVDIGYVGETPPVFAQSGGVPFVYVATDPPAPKAEAIIVRKDSPIKSVAQLKGKKIALNRGSNVHYLLLEALEREKLGIRDVEVTYLSPGDARPAFETGQVDAWVIWDPFLAAAEQAGARALANGEGLVDNHLFYVVRREFAEKSPELVRLALDEYQALSEWEAKHPEESAKILARSSGVSYEALLLSEQRHTYGILPITPEILQKQQAIADAFKELELIPKEIRTAEAFIPALSYAKAP